MTNLNQPPYIARFLPGNRAVVYANSDGELQVIVDALPIDHPSLAVINEVIRDFIRMRDQARLPLIYQQAAILHTEPPK
jgi:hypothetical protein